MTGQGTGQYDVHANYTTYVTQHHHLAMANPDAGTALSFDDYTAEHSATRLGTDASDLSAEVGNIDAAPDTVFGLSSVGRRLQAEADLAHGKLKGAVDLLASAMDSYSSAVLAAKKTFIDTDADAGSSMVVIQQSLNAGDLSVTTPTAAVPTVKDEPAEPTSQTGTPNSPQPGPQLPQQTGNGGE